VTSLSTASSGIVELVLGEGEHRAVVDVRRTDRDEGFALLHHVGIGHAVEHQVVINDPHLVIDGVERIQHPLPLPRHEVDAPDVGLDVLLEEVLLEIREQLVAIDPVVCGREAAAGDSGDRIELVEKTAVAALNRHVKVAQATQHAIGKRRRALAAA